MKTGIYSFTFSDESQFIGRGLDLDKTWKAHLQDLKIGIASRNLQLAYNKLGTPRVQVLQECHSDHLEILESYYVCLLQPVLNDVGSVKIDDPNLHILQTNSDLLKLSTVELLNYIVDMESEIKSLLDSDLVKNLKEANFALVNLADRLTDAETLAEAYKEELHNKWWKKVFKWL